MDFFFEEKFIFLKIFHNKKATNKYLLMRKQRYREI